MAELGLWPVGFGQVFDSNGALGPKLNGLTAKVILRLNGPRYIRSPKYKSNSSKKKTDKQAMTRRSSVYYVLSRHVWFLDTSDGVCISYSRNK